MAIQFNLPNIARRTMPEETGIPDYGSALSKGLDLGYKSQSLANKQIAEELANRISTGKAKYAMQQALADLQNTQAQTGHLGAQTRGLNIENEFLPKKLQLAQQIQEVKARYAEQREKNEIQKLISGNRLTNQQADELGISNKTLGEKLRIANQIAAFKANHPLLYTTGIPQQLGSIEYAMQHPELNGSSGTPGQSPTNLELNYGNRGKPQNQPMDMEVNFGRNAPAPKPSRIRESSIPSIGRRFEDNIEPEIPYEQLSRVLGKAFNNPNESKIPSIGQRFEEPNYSQLANIPALMTLIGNQRQQAPALPQQQAPVEPMKPLEQQNPEKMNLADIIRQSMLPKSAKGALSTLAKLQGERQNIEQGRYPGSLMPIENQQKQQALLKENEAQINSQIYGKGGKDEESVRLQKELTQEKIKDLRRGKPIGGKFGQLERLRDQYPKGSAEYKKYDKALDTALEGTSGITLYDPNGNPMVQIGGSPNAKGSAKGGQLYMNEKGDVYQLPTTALGTQLQNRIVGEKIVTPYLKNIIDTMPQFQSGWTSNLTAAEGFANKWLGTDYALPSQLQKGVSSMGIAAEGLLREFGLNATTQNLKRTEAIITPGDGESTDGYKKRATAQLLDFATTARQAQEMSNSGILVKKGTGKTPDFKKMTEEELKKMAGGK